MLKVLAVVAVATLSGCAMNDGAMTPAASETGRATATLRGATGIDHGVVTLSGGTLSVEGRNLPPGAHGFHIHQTGRCDAPDFMTAGGHWNPTMRQHGRDNPAGAHAGDYPNLIAGTDGRGSVSISFAGDMAALMDADGAAVVVHSAADDYRTDPSGNSGGRIACGVLMRG